MHSNETLLENFIENIGTLPQEIRRNLAHMRSLDQSYACVVEELRDCEEEYLKRAHDIISNLDVQSRDQYLAKRKRKSSEGENVAIEAAQERDMSTLPSSADEDDNSQVSRHFWTEVKEGIVVEVPTNNAGMSNTEENDDGSAKDGSQSSKNVVTELIIPTSEELRLHIQDTDALVKIALLRKTAREIVEEKLSNARQTYAIVDDVIKKLDVDLEEFEALLKSTGQYETVLATGIAQPNDLAAIQVTPNSPDWILAKVISHDPQTGMYNLSDEDIESNKTFLLPESQVVILGGVDRLNRGDVIYGVYPDTTSFYQATVVEIPKKIPGRDAFVLVHFKDDGDEHGITHAKVVPMKHIMRVPYGAIK